MLRVRGGFLLTPCGYIRLFVAVLPRNPVILDPRVDSDAISMNVGPDVIQFEVVADVAVELAIIEIARIANRGTPNLTRGIGITAEGGNTGRASDGCVDAVSRPVVRPRHAVGFKNGVPYTVFPQKAVHARVVAALREPKTLRRLPENLPVVLHANSDLRPYRGFI